MIVIIPAISYHSSVFMFLFILNTLIYDVKSNHRSRAKLHLNPVRFGAAACGIISSCISTFYLFSGQFSIKQIKPGWGLQFPLGCRQSCNISAPDALLTCADFNIYHVCVLSCKVLQPFPHMCDFDLHQSTPGSCWTYFQTGSALHYPRCFLHVCLSSGLWGLLSRYGDTPQAQSSS